MSVRPQGGLGDTRIVGIKQTRRDLAAIDKALGREFTKGLRESAKIVSDEARSEARRGNVRSDGTGRRAYGRVQAHRGTRQQRKVATGIKPFANAKGTGVRVKNTAGKPFAEGAFYGAGRPQMPPWVGRTYNIDAANQGPYVLGDAWREKKPEAAEAAYQVVLDNIRKLDTLQID